MRVIAKQAAWGAFVVIVLAASATSRAADPAFDHFSSFAGGFSLDVPKGWHHVEETGENSYVAAISREKVEKRGDVYVRGLTVTRLRGWRELMPDLPADPVAAAEAYANQFAAQFEGGKTAVIDGGYDDSYGMNLRYFHVVASLGTPECVQMRLLVGIEGKQWLTALWEVPCSEFEAADAEMRHMRETLKIGKKWGAKAP